jgi:hypothetical protein
MNFDNTTRMVLGLIQTHHRAEPQRDDYPADDGHAQAAYWAAYDEWQAIGYGLRLMVGGRLIEFALAQLEAES